MLNPCKGRRTQEACRASHGIESAFTRSVSASSFESLRSYTKNLLHFNRRLHLYSGLFMIPFVLVFGLSGMFFNHTSWMSEKTSTVFEAHVLAELLGHYPPAEGLADELLAVVADREAWTNARAAEVRWSGPSILRTRVDRTDHRLEVDPNASRAMLLTMPDFALAPPIASGQDDSLTVTDNAALVESFEEWLVARGLESGASRVQRGAELLVDVEVDDRTLRVELDPSTGSYRVHDLDDRKFSTRDFLENLHVIHRYPLSKSDPAWTWVLLADALAALMIVWAVSGVIMWLRMPRILLAGLAFMVASSLVFAALAFALRELGY